MALITSKQRSQILPACSVVAGYDETSLFPLYSSLSIFSALPVQISSHRGPQQKKILPVRCYVLM